MRRLKGRRQGVQQHGTPGMRGHIDIVDGRRITGWLQGRGGERMQVRVVAEDDGRLLAEAVADIARGDLLEAGVGDGRHGFELNVEAEPQREIRARVLSADGGFCLGEIFLPRTNAVIDPGPKAAQRRDELLRPFLSSVRVNGAIGDAASQAVILYDYLLEHYRLFDADFYRATYGRDIPQGEDALVHYLTSGSRRGFWPNPYFDPAEYVRINPDVLETGIDPIIHYFLFGWNERRETGSHFDAEFYLETHPDVLQAGINPLYHYLAFGKKEGRIPVRLSEAALQAAEPLAPVATGFGARSSGLLLLVSHDFEVGGAQQLLRSLAEWLLASTKYDVKFVAMKDGAHRHLFEAIAPVHVVSRNMDPAQAEQEIRAFAGETVRGLFVNSVASTGFFEVWSEDTPAVSYVHELEKIIGKYPGCIERLAERCNTILGGSAAVTENLRQTHGVDPEKVRLVYDFIGPVSEVAPSENARAARRASLGLDPEAFVVMGCGVMHWRKSPDKFIEIAERVARQTGRPCKFVWIGGGPDEEACRQMVRDKDLGQVVELIGYQEDVAGVLEAADLFLLPSEEDPFPLVCLYAAAKQVPVVCFEEAGGMPEFVARGCGLAVPFGDVDAMAQAVLDYMADPARLADHGATGRAAVQAEFSVTATGPQILEVLRSAMGVAPHVSIVVPNYNYGAYLEQRLTSIYEQSFQDFEVILLDDASPDGSGAILEDWARRRPATRAILNEQNSGSPFAQWMKGMREARSDLVWIAEADDYCEPGLLAALVPAMDDRNVFLAHAKSMPVNAEGTSLGDYDTLYLNRIAEGRWMQSYVATDHLEVNAGLAVGNVIPNASAVMIRKFEPEPAFVEQVTSMRMCGDWYFYLRALRGGNLAFDARTLNYHRRHGNTVTHQTEGSLRYFEELAEIRQYVDRTYRIAEATQAQAEAFTLQDLDRFGIEDAAQRDAVRRASGLTAGKEIPSLLMVASDLSPGGGQMFAIRLANAWAARGGRAVLLNVGYSATHEKVLSRIDPGVVLIGENDPRLRNLAGLCADYDIDIIHSSIWWADKYVRQQIEALPQMPWVTTMHGCHETLLENSRLDVDFAGDYAFMRDRMDCWIHIADKNMRVFQELGAPRHHERIANGVPSPTVRAVSRAELGLRDDSVLLCLVSRGIKEKGWFQAVEIARRLNGEGLNVELMLVGEGPAATEIRKQGLDFVHLYGHVDNVDELISVCDVGILPSTFIGESMPLVLLEMMALAKPIVATDVGEIPEMIGKGEGAAGIVVPNVDGDVDIPAYCEAIRRVIGDEVVFSAYAKAAKQRFDAKYDIRKMIQDYASLYDKCLEDRASALRCEEAL